MVIGRDKTVFRAFSLTRKISGAFTSRTPNSKGAFELNCILNASFFFPAPITNCEWNSWKCDSPLRKAWWWRKRSGVLDVAQFNSPAFCEQWELKRRLSVSASTSGGAVLLILIHFLCVCLSTSGGRTTTPRIFCPFNTQTSSNQSVKDAPECDLLFHKLPVTDLPTVLLLANFMCIPKIAQNVRD